MLWSQRENGASQLRVFGRCESSESERDKRGVNGVEGRIASALRLPINRALASAHVTHMPWMQVDHQGR